MIRNKSAWAMTALFMGLCLILAVQEALAAAGSEAESADLLARIGPARPGACNLPAPNLLSPADQASTGLAPLFKFSTVEGVTSYGVWVSLEADMSPWVVASVRTYPSVPAGWVDYFDMLDENLMPNTTYYWRMGSRCEDNSYQYTPIYSFVTNAVGKIPPVPVVNSPADETTSGSTRVNFVFEPVVGVSTYQIRLYNSLDDPYYAFSFASGRPIVSRILEPERLYYWRAISRNGHGWSALTPMRMLMTPPVTATIVLQPGVAGQLTPDPGNISFNFPAGTVTETTHISYTLQAEPNHDLANFRFGGRAFSLEASNELGQPVATFGQWFTMTVSYDAFDLLAADLFDSELNLAFWNGSNWQNLLPCAGCSLDTNNRTLIVVLDHLTDFTLLGDTSGREHIYLPVVTHRTP